MKLCGTQYRNKGTVGRPPLTNGLENGGTSSEDNPGKNTEIPLTIQEIIEHTVSLKKNL